jgi:hypothetical protein
VKIVVREVAKMREDDVDTFIDRNFPLRAQAATMSLWETIQN